jgi:hypothetical protein
LRQLYYFILASKLNQFIGCFQPSKSTGRTGDFGVRNFEESKTPQYVYYQPLKACVEGALTTFVIGDAS